MLIVTIRSLDIEVASRLFHENVNVPEEVQKYMRVDSPASHTYFFKSDEQIREIRMWGTSARGCGLIDSIAVQQF